MNPKFKYLLSPENIYIIDFGDFKAEVTGQEIMNRIYRELNLEKTFTEDQSSSKG
jgi:hypothetical protein